MSSMMLTHKICLDPTHKQARYFKQACGIARFTWNWALGEWQRRYELGALYLPRYLVSQINGTSVYMLRYPCRWALARAKQVLALT